MKPHELAGYILQDLAAPETRQQGGIHIRNYCTQQVTAFDEPSQDGRAVGLRCGEAIAWLLHNGFLAQDYAHDHGWLVITEAGSAVADHVKLNALLAERELPATFLHPEIASASRERFLRGEFDTAVFKAFRAVEIRMREAAGLGQELVGQKLAQRAFNPDDGPLTDRDAETGERVALMNLMVGALGSFKNPTSHRHVALTAPDTRDLIVLASHLLKIVESRTRTML